MRITNAPDLDIDGKPVKPVSTWKPSKAALHYKGIAAGETVHFRVLAWSLIIGGALYIMVFLRTPIKNDQVVIMHLKGYLLMVMMHVLLAFLYNRAADFIDLGPSLKKLQAKVPREDAVPITLTIRQSGVTTGNDQGYMWLDEGTLYYKGRQTAFRLTRDDLPAATLMPRRERPDLNKGKFPKTLTVPANGRDLKLDIKLIEPYEDFTTRRRSQQFQIDLATWILDRPEADIESLLPPTQVHTSLVRKGWAKYEPLFAGGFLVALNGILMFAVLYGYQMGTTQSALNHIAATIHVFLVCLSLYIAFRAWKTAKVREELLAEESKESF